MRRKLCLSAITSLVLLCVTAVPAFATREKIQGWCQNGGTAVTIPGTQGSGNQRFQQSFRSCTVTVYLAGTTTLATLYADTAGTAKANPFTASSVGQWFFYAEGGSYDVMFSGGGISAPFTLGDFSIRHDILECTDYGVTGNGTTNDTTALQRCITAATEGSTVHISGTPLITSTISVSTGNIRITGQGQDTNARIKMTGVLSLPMFQLETGSIRFDHLMLQGDGSSTGGGIDATNTGILASKTGDASFADFDLYVNQVTFSQLQKGIDYRGRNLTVQESVFSHVRYGILCTGATAPSGGNRGCMVQQSRFHSMGSDHSSTTTRSYAITLPAAAQNFFEVQIQDNYADDIENFITGNARSGIVTGNHIARASGGGASGTSVPIIEIDTTGNTGSTIGWLIADNDMMGHIVGTTTAWTGQHAIFITGNYFTVDGNHIERPGGNCIRVAASNAYIKGANTCINPSYGTTGGGALAGVLVSAAANVVSDVSCLKDDANSGMTYCIDPGSNPINLGPYYSSGQTVAAVNIDTTNTAALEQFRARFTSNTAGTYVITMGDAATNDARIRDDGLFEMGGDVALWRSAAATMAIRDVSGAANRIFFVSTTGQVGLTSIVWTPTLFANLGTPSSGEERYCSDCTVTGVGDNTCAGGGTGAKAVRLNGVWRCFNNQN